MGPRERTSECSHEQQHRVAEDDRDAVREGVVAHAERRRHEADAFEEHIAGGHQCAVIEGCSFHPFSGQIGPDRDTEKWRGDAEGGIARGGDDTENERGGDRDEEAEADVRPFDIRERAAIRDPRSVADATGEKETDPRGLRGSAGSRKVPDTKIKKATTLVVAQDNLSASSSRTSSPSS